MLIRTSQKLLAGAATAALLSSPAFAQDGNVDEVITTGVVSSKGKNKIDTSISVSSVNLEIQLAVRNIFPRKKMVFQFFCLATQILRLLTVL